MWLNFHQNWRYLIFQRGRNPLLGGLTILKRSWNSGDLPYLVANIYGLNFIKIGGIWIFCGRNPLLGWGGGDYIWPVMPIFELGWAISQSHVWLGFVEIGGMSIFREAEAPYCGGVGVTCVLRCPFSNLAELFQSKVMCENLVQIGWAIQELSFEFSAGQEAPVRGVTCDLRCPFSELGWAIPAKRNVWIFGSDWLSLSRVIVVTDKKKKK